MPSAQRRWRQGLSSASLSSCPGTLLHSVWSSISCPHNPKNLSRLCSLLFNHRSFCLRSVRALLVLMSAGHMALILNHAASACNSMCSPCSSSLLVLLASSIHLSKTCHSHSFEALQTFKTQF